MSGPFGDNPFCNVCKCRVGVEGQMALEHYKTDWHRYNVKLQVAGGVPISEEVFMKKYLALKQKLEAELQTHEKHRCEDCRKVFRSKNAFEQHLQSKTHLKTIRNRRGSAHAPPGGPAAVSAVSAVSSAAPDEAAGAQVSKKSSSGPHKADPEGPIPTNVCLFCNFASRNTRNNIKHMMKEHGFFVPFVEFVVDLEGLIEYLGYKIGVGHVCIWCNGRVRAAYGSTEAVQQHMLTKSHCRIQMDETIEFKNQELAVLSSDEDEDDIETDTEETSEENHNTEDGSLEEEEDGKDGSEDAEKDDLGPSPDEFLPFYRFPGQVDIIESDQLDEDGEPKEEEILQVTPEERQRTQELYPEPIPEPQAKAKRTLVDIADTQELVLSDGSLIGHRQYSVIYRQNLRETKRGQLIQSLLHKRGANQGQLVRHAQPQGKAAYSDIDRKALREKAKSQRLMQKKSNQTNRHYFRWQLLF